MKYIFINIKNFGKNEKIIMILVILCIFSSAIIINFSFGFYHHLEQKKLDDISGMKELNIDFQDKGKKTVTKGNLLEILCQLDDNILNNCVIQFSGRFIQDQTDNAAIDHTLLSVDMSFIIKDGKVTVAPLEEILKENNILIDGNYFTAEQFENGELVCLASIEKEFGSEEENFWAKKYSINQNGKYTVNGKDYTCIGHVDTFSCVPLVPITTIADDCYIQSVLFTFNNVLTRKSYIEISKSIRDAYGDLANIPSLDIQEVDNLKFYNTLLVICILLISMSAVVLSMLYEYVMLQRKRQLTIYRLCGMTRGKAKLIYFMECILLSIIIYMFAMIFFHFVMLPYLGNIFEYITASYSLYSYALIGFLYMVISAVILYIMICRQMGYDVVNELKEV